MISKKLDHERRDEKRMIRSCNSSWVEKAKASRSNLSTRSPPARGLRGDCFALRDLCEPRHHRCGIAVQDLCARILPDIRFRERLAGPLAAEFGSVGAAHDALGAVQAHCGLDRAWAERVAIYIHLCAAEAR